MSEEENYIIENETQDTKETGILEYRNWFK